MGGGGEEQAINFFCRSWPIYLLPDLDVLYRLQFNLSRNLNAPHGLPAAISQVRHRIHIKHFQWRLDYMGRLVCILTGTGSLYCLKCLLYYPFGGMNAQDLI